MKRVLVLRAEEDAQRTAAKLRKMGFAPVVSPVLAVIGLNAAIPPGDYDAILATSAKGMEHAGPPREKIPLHVVGAKTAEVARGLGWAPQLVAGNAKALLPLLHERYPRPAHFLYIAARDRQRILEDGLATAGHRLTLIETYAAEAAQTLSPEAIAALAAREIAVVLHYSKRSVEIFLALVDKAGLRQTLAATEHLALSREVAAPLIALGLSPRIAEEPDEAGLLALLK